MAEPSSDDRRRVTEKAASAKKAVDESPELSVLTAENVVKVILLGDSAVGKSKLVERFLMNGYEPRQLSTYALTLFRHNYKDAESGADVCVDFWDTAGQERFSSIHPSYYYRAHCCILAFDVTRKATYKNMERWYNELREYCGSIPVLVCANKIDIDYKVRALVRGTVRPAEPRPPLTARPPRRIGRARPSVAPPGDEQVVQLRVQEGPALLLRERRGRHQRRAGVQRRDPGGAQQEEGPAGG